MSGTVLAQFIGLLMMPILTRLYTPAEFGLFGSFVSLLGICGAGVTLQYSQAIILPKEDSDGAGMLIVSCLSVLGMSVLLAAVSAVFPNQALSLMKGASSYWVLALLLAAIVVNGFNQSFQAWAVRRKAFRRTAVSQVIRSLFTYGFQTSTGVAGVGTTGLIGGQILGDAAASGALIGQNRAEDWKLVRGAFQWDRLKSLAHKFCDFPAFSMPQNVMNQASQGLPVLLFAGYFGGVVAGNYALTVRILQAPMSLVLNSLRQVLLQKATEEHNQNRPLWPLFRKTTTSLVALASFPTLVCALLAPTVFSWLFGPNWADAGQYARWLILWVAVGFCNLPATLLGRILRQQRNLFFYDLALLAARISSLVIGGLFLTALQTIVLYSLIGTLFNAFLIFWIATLVLAHDKQLKI